MKNLKLHFLLFGAEAEINFRPPAAAVVRKHLGPMELLLPPPPARLSLAQRGVAHIVSVLARGTS